MARLEIIGERGRLQVRSFITPQWGGGMTLQRDDLDEELDVGGLPTWEAQLAHVVEVLQGRAEPLTGGIDAISNMTVIDAIKRIAIQEGPQS
jgi:predicted dehydrogenase